MRPGKSRVARASLREVSVVVIKGGGKNRNLRDKPE